MKEIKLDLLNIETEDQFHDFVQNKLEFPYYYGRNADAFWDCITDIFDEISFHVLNYDKQSSFVKRQIDVYIYMMFLYQEKRKGRFSIHVYFD